jgi:hypothetical protein
MATPLAVPAAPMETIRERDEVRELMSWLKRLLADKQATDAEGWVYGDNKWEYMGPKGGLGKVSSKRNRRLGQGSDVSSLVVVGGTDVLCAPRLFSVSHPTCRSHHQNQRARKKRIRPQHRALRD